MEYLCFVFCSDFHAYAAEHLNAHGNAYSDGNCDRESDSNQNPIAVCKPHAGSDCHPNPNVYDNSVSVAPSNP